MIFRKQLEQLKKGDDVEVHFKETAQDFVDAGTEELTKFKFASRITGLYVKCKYVETNCSNL
mgnify:FL=1